MGPHHGREHSGDNTPLSDCLIRQEWGANTLTSHAVRYGECYNVSFSWKGWKGPSQFAQERKVPTGGLPEPVSQRTNRCEERVEIRLSKAAWLKPCCTHLKHLSLMTYPSTSARVSRRQAIPSGLDTVCTFVKLDKPCNKTIAYSESV